MAGSELHYLELVDIGRRIQKKEISSVEATQAQLDRIAKLDGTLKSYATLMGDQASQMRAPRMRKSPKARFAGRCMACRSRSRICAGPRA